MCGGGGGGGISGKGLLGSMFGSLQTKKAYEKASEEGESAMHTLEKADNDPNSTKAKIDKVLGVVGVV